MNAPLPDDDPLDLDRLADAALGGADDLDDPEAEALALAAAAATLALTPRDEPLPAALRARLEADADRFFAPPQPAARRRSWAWAGWAAAAASWLLTVTLLWPGKSGRTPATPGPPTLSPVAWTVPLNATDHPLAAGAGGTLSWDPSRQRGRLTLRGLAGVDPKRSVYQLWIFDARRDPRYPVDGGTFAVADAAGTTVVPVEARLPVAEPTGFAVTLEPAGGVVVSDRLRVVLTAAPP